MTTLGTELPYCLDFKDFFKFIHSFVCLHWVLVVALRTFSGGI